MWSDAEKKDDGGGKPSECQLHLLFDAVIMRKMLSPTLLGVFFFFRKGHITLRSHEIE